MNKRMPPLCMKQVIKFVSSGYEKPFSRPGNNPPPIGQIVTGRSTRKHTADIYTELGLGQAEVILVYTYKQPDQGPCLLLSFRLVIALKPT